MFPYLTSSLVQCCVNTKVHYVVRPFHIDLEFNPSGEQQLKLKVISQKLDEDACDTTFFTKKTN